MTLLAARTPGAPTGPTRATPTSGIFRAKALLPLPLPHVPQGGGADRRRLLRAGQAGAVRGGRGLNVGRGHRGVVGHDFEGVDEESFSLVRVDAPQHPSPQVVELWVGIAVSILAVPAIFRTGQIRGHPYHVLERHRPLAIGDGAEFAA